MNYLVTYDVTDAKRLKRIGRMLLRYGVRVEKSVFLCDLEPAKLPKLEGELRENGADEDTILVFQLPSQVKCRAVYGELRTGAAADIY